MSCGCRWARVSGFGDVVVEQCRGHADATMASMSSSDDRRSDVAQREMDREIDEAIGA